MRMIRIFNTYDQQRVYIQNILSSHKKGRKKSSKKKKKISAK